MRGVNAARAAVAVPLILYGISLFLPVVNDIEGIYALFGGLLSLLVRDAWGAVWLANHAFFAAVVLTFVQPRAALVVALVAVAFASPAFGIHWIVANEGGTRTRAALSVGFYVWYAAFVALALLLAALQRRLRAPEAGGPKDRCADEPSPGEAAPPAAPPRSSR
ncbi:MAG: hypothetical protein R3A79_18470 [Nannocystaceae bacterium]